MRFSGGARDLFVTVSQNVLKFEHGSSQFRSGANEVLKKEKKERAKSCWLIERRQQLFAVSDDENLD